MPSHVQAFSRKLNTTTDAAEAKQLISAGVLNQWYIRNAGPDNQPPPAAPVKTPAKATAESAT